MSREVDAVHTPFRRFTPFLFAPVLAAPVFCAECTASVRVYDPYHHDHHVWAAEEPYYARWDCETHRDHMDFDKRSDADKKAYWDWRHGQH